MFMTPRHRPPGRSGQVLLSGLALFLLAAGAVRAALGAALVSQSPGGQPALSHARSSQPSISADGRYVAFLSDASWPQGDLHGRTSLYVKDRVTGAVELASISPTGEPANQNILAQALSADGRYAAFLTTATNLAPGVGTNPMVIETHAYLRDRVNGTTTLVDTRPNGLASSSVSNGHIAVSSVGPVVVYGQIAGDGPGISLVARNMQTGAVDPVSVSTAGIWGNQGAAYRAVITPDGRYVAFDSRSDNLVPGDTNGAEDVFVRDRQQQTTERVSLTPGGAQLSLGAIFPHISGDGRVVLFQSDDPALASGQAWLNYFARDRQTGAVESLLTADNIYPGRMSSQNAEISSDGRYAAFAMQSYLLSPSMEGSQVDVYVRDRVAGTVTRVTQTAPEARGDSTEPCLSADGRWMAFTSSSTGLTPDDTNSANDIFVWDRQAGATTRASVSSSGGDLTRRAISGQPALSAGGEFVAFQSDAFNLTPEKSRGSVGFYVWTRRSGAVERVDLTTSGEPLNPAHLESARDTFRGPSITPDGRVVVFTEGGQVYLRDRTSGVTELISVSMSGTPGDTPSNSGGQAVSADGRYVVFISNADDLVPGDTNRQQDVFLRDRQAGTTTRVNLSPDGFQSTARDDYFHPPAISADGRVVAFSSKDPQLEPGDTNGLEDVFVRDLVARVTRRVSVRTDGTEARASGTFYPTASHTPLLSADGRYVAFISNASNLDPANPVLVDNTFIHDRGNGTTELASYLPNGGVLSTAPYPFGATLSGFSGDGRYVLFHAIAWSFAPHYVFGDVVTLLRDRVNGATTPVSPSDGNRFWDTDPGEGHPGALSPDGRWAAFAADLVGPDKNPNRPLDVYAVRTPTPPLPPVNLAAAEVTGRQVRLTWTNQDPLTTSFHVERRSAAGDWTLLATVGGAVTAYADPVSPLTSYAYRVSAVGDAGASEYSNVVSVITPVDPPDPPVLISAEVSASGLVTLTWTEASANVTQFRIERAEPGVPFGLLATVDGGVHTYVDSHLTTNIQYRYRVVAQGDAAFSDYSNELSAVVRPALAAPSVTTVQATSPVSARLTWSESDASVTSFHVERRAGNGAYSEVGNAAGTASTYADTGLTPGAEYTYRVRAEKPGVFSAYSNEVTITMPDGLPAPPSSLAVRPLTDTQVDLEWTAGDPAAETRVERKTGAGEFVEIGTVAPGTHDYEDKTVTGGTVYVYRMRAHNQYGFSGYSAAIPVTTPAPASGIVVIPAKLTFPMTKVRQTSRALLTIRNSDRKHALRVTVIAPTVPFEFLGRVEPVLIPAGGSKKYELHFTPASKGMSVGKLTVKTSQPGRETVTVALTGKGKL